MAAGAASAAEPVVPGPDVDGTNQSNQRPLWELGVGVAGVRLPEYRGSDRSHGYLLPLPYVVYRGTFVKADRDGARALLFDSDRVKLDLSFAASAPARSDAASARAGMPSLRGLAEIGPNLNLRLAESSRDRWKLDLRLPVRAAFTLERSPKFVGTTFSPNLNFDMARLGGGWNLGVLTGPVFGSRRYHDHFYSVDSAYANAARPAYQAGAGYGGWQALASTSRRFGNMWVGAFVRYDALGGAVFDDSPLVRRHSALTAGFGVSWILTTSTERVTASD